MATSVDLNNATEVKWRLGTADLNDVVLTVTRPDSTTDTPSVTETTPAGTYAATVIPTLPGRYVLSWSSPSVDATYGDVINVFPSDPRFIIGIQEAKSVLRIPPGQTGMEDDLRMILAATTIVLETLVDTIVAKPFVQETDGGRPSIVLWHKVTEGSDLTVKVNGIVQVEERDYVVDRRAMIVHAGSRTSPGWFPPGRLNVEITYSTGSSIIDPAIRLATSTMVKHLYAILTSGHNQFPVDEGAEGGATMVKEYLVPNMVIALCKSAPKLPGF